MRKQKLSSKEQNEPWDQDEPKEQNGEGKDDRDKPIEEVASGVTGTSSDPVPTGDPDIRRPPYEGPKGGRRPRKRNKRKVA